MNWKCRMNGLMVFLAVLRNIYLQREGLRVPVTIVWPLEASRCSSHVWGELRSLRVEGHNCYEPVIYTYIQWYIWFSSGFSDKNGKYNLYDVIIFDAHWVTCMSFFFFLWHQYSSAQLFFIHINFIHVISVRFSKFKCLFLLLKLHNVDQKCIRWLTVTCHVCTVLFSQWCNGSKVGVHNVWPLKAHPVWWLSWIFQRQGHHTSLSALHCHIFFNHSYLIHSI